MSNKGPLIDLPNPGRKWVTGILPDKFKKYGSVLTEAPGDPGGAFRDAAKLAAPDPGEPPVLPDAPNLSNSGTEMAAASAGQRKARGRAATVLSSAGSSSAIGSARRTLLGS